MQTVFGATQTRRPIDDDPRRARARISDETQAHLLRRRQHHVEHGAGEGVLPRADPAQDSLGEPGEHQRRPRRGVSRPDRRSGCRGVLIGFESLNPANLRAMHKTFNTMSGGYRGGARRTCAATDPPLWDVHLRIRRATRPTPSPKPSSSPREHGFYIAAFNHLTPFPGTPLYDGSKPRDGCSTNPGGSTSATATTWCRSGRAA